MSQPVAGAGESLAGAGRKETVVSGVKGRSGKSPRPFAECLAIAVNRISPTDPEGRKRLMVIAEKLCEMAEAGEMDAVREVAVRLDGRPLSNEDSDEPEMEPNDDTAGRVRALIDLARGRA